MISYPLSKIETIEKKESLFFKNKHGILEIILSRGYTNENIFLNYLYEDEIEKVYFSS